jgi:sialidase-1
VQRRNGDLLANMRSNVRKRLRATAISSDRGKTWTGFRHHDGLVEPVCQASMMWYDAAKTFLLFANPADTERRRLAIKVSKDEGKTWPVEKVLHDGPAAYSSMAVMPDGTIGVLYERGIDSPYETVTFTKIAIDWLMK